jgi:hypothetical protein
MKTFMIVLAWTLFSAFVGYCVGGLVATTEMYQGELDYRD